MKEVNLMTIKRPNTEKIIKEDIERIKAYEKPSKCLLMKMQCTGLPEPYPREVNGVVEVAIDSRA